MVKVTKVTDISSNNPSTLSYIKSLYDHGSRFNFVKLTQGNWYLNSSASQQIVNTLKVFNDYVGIYHYIDSGSSIEQQASYFIGWLKKFGFDKTTQVMLDTEDSGLNNVTAKINQFDEILIKNGYKRLWTYSMDSWFSTGRIIPHCLKYSRVWTASYGAYPKVAHSVWQYDGLGTQDWELDYSGILNCDKKNQVKVKNYLKSGSKFQVVAKDGIWGYSDKRFNKSHGNLLAYRSIVYGKIVKVGHVTRIKTNIGYFSANTEYVKKLK